MQDRPGAVVMILGLSKAIECDTNLTDMRRAWVLLAHHRSTPE